ncbi:MAG: PD-(D/E)XK nuclease domain-containing protein [Paludibacteraceae bacterium]|nr:PD-(D/E)XK nuclease domain-containing protein [Paludibacteraceae bacterium]
MKMNDEQLCAYVEKWFAARYDKWTTIYRYIRMDRVNGIYRLPDGRELLDALDSLMGNFEEHLYSKNLLPVYFSSPHQLLTFLQNYGAYCEEQLKWMLALPIDEKQDREVGDIIEMYQDVVELTTYCLQSYEVNIVDDTYLKPYLNMKACLDGEDIGEFIIRLKAIYSSIPSSIHKGNLNEALFHSVAHSVMYQLGFRAYSESETSEGRMDMRIEMNKHIYIFEFKYSEEDKDMSDDALMQINDKHYADPYVLLGKKVIAVGVTFGKKKRNVIGYKSEVLN